MNATKIMIISALMAGLVLCGVWLGRWAAEQSRATEARWNEAVAVLGQR